MLTTESDRAENQGSVIAAGLVASAPYLVFVSLCVVANWIFSNSTLHLFTGGTPLLSVVFLAVLGFVGAGVTYRDIPAAVSIVLRITLSFSIFYVVTSRIHLSGDLVGHRSDLGILINHVWVIAAGFGLLGMIRPSFGLLTLFYIHLQKQSVAALFGIPVTSVDYITIIDTTGLLIIAAMLFRPFCRLGDRFKLVGERPAGARSLGLMEAAFLAAIALHFGNYFYGALGKMALGDGPLYWVLENKTEYLILASREVGANPLSFSDDFAGLMYQWFSSSSPLFNLATLASQLFCVVLVVRPKLAMLTTAFFDLMHLGIFIFTGIFFWKFILLNLSIVLGLRRMLEKRVPGLFAVYLVVLVVVSPIFFHINYFFWLDTRSMNSVKFWAVDEDGKDYRVSANYFLPLSATINQQRLVYPENGPFPTWTWGTTRHLDEVRASEDCRLERHSGSGPENRYFVPKDQIEKSIRRYHKFVSQKFTETGHFNYDIYPHHIFSVPWVFREFKNLDKRRIVKYRYTIEALCLGHDDQGFSRQVVWQDGFEIMLDGN